MNSKALIQEIERYCERAGISPSTLGVRAVGNSRLYDRLKARVERDEETAQKLREHMAAHPPKREEGAA